MAVAIIRHVMLVRWSTASLLVVAFGILTAASAHAQTATATPTPPAAPITIQKSVCSSIGPNMQCQGYDQSLANYSVDFEVFSGTDLSVDPATEVAVKLNQSGGAQGSVATGRLDGPEYTVCEV